MNTNLDGLNLPAWVVDNLDAIAAFETLSAPARACLVTGCTRDAVRCGLCRSHYVRARDTFGPVPPSRTAEGRKRAQAGTRHDEVPRAKVGGAS